VKVLLLSNLYPPDVFGGYELIARDVVLHLKRRGHDVHVLTSGVQRARDPKWVHRDLRLVRPFGTPAGLERTRHLALALHHRWAVRRLLSRHTFDVVLVMSLRRMGFHAIRELSQHGVDPVFCVNDEWPLAFCPGDAATDRRRSVFAALERLPWLRSRTWHGQSSGNSLFISQALRERVREGGAPFDGETCLQGVDLDQFFARGERAFGDPIRMLFVGRLDREKACDHAIDALAALRDRGVRARLTIAGRGVEEASLRSHAERSKVGDAVDWLGQVPHASLPRIYREHDVLLFPSRWAEPAGLTHLEALASGVPVVVHATGGVAEMLEHERDCLFAAEGTSMARAVLRLRDDAGMRARLNRGGIRTARAKASLENYVDRIESRLRAVASD